MIINLFSGPRNVSTALMYSFAQRSDTHVMDEPWYGYYLSATGADHPGREEVLSRMETDGRKIYDNILLARQHSPIVFIKNMCHHYVDLDLAWLESFENVFLIRDPADMLPSLMIQVPRPVLRDTGLAMQWKLFESLRKKGRDPAVIDAEILSDHPSSVLRRLCLHLHIPFEESMLKWEKGPRPEDGIWAKYWYHKVHESDGFKPYKRRNTPLPDKLISLLSACKPYYEKLYQYVIK